jgi:hypothetical protein
MYTKKAEFFTLIKKLKKTTEKTGRKSSLFCCFGEVKNDLFYLPVSHPKIQSKGAKKRSSIITPPYAK